MTSNKKELIITSDSSGERNSAAVWDPVTGSLVTQYKNAGALSHHTLQILNDSYLIAADLSKPWLHLWSLNSQTPVSHLRLTTPGKVTALNCTPKGSYIIAAVNEKLYIWQTSTGRLLATVARHYQTVTCIAFTDDGSAFATGAEDGLVFVWSLCRLVSQQQTTPVHSFSDHSLPVKDLHFGHFGSLARLCSVSLDRTAKIYDANAGILLLTLVFQVPLTSVTMDPRESDLFVGCSDGTIQRVNLREPPRGMEFHVGVNSEKEDKENTFHGHEGAVVSLSVSIDCDHLLSGSSDGNVHIWDIPSRRVIRKFAHKGPITTAKYVNRLENFQVAQLKPKVIVKPFQRISGDKDGDDTIEMISSTSSDTEMLDFNSFATTKSCNDKNDDKSMEPDGQQLIRAQEEIERLKRINSELYRHSMKFLLDQPSM